MAPRSFTEDGASGGAMSTSAGSGAAPTASPQFSGLLSYGGYQGIPSNTPSAQTARPDPGMTPGGFGSGGGPGSLPSSRFPSPGLAPASSGGGNSARGPATSNAPYLGLMFEDGGTVPDAGSSGGGDLVSQALDTVDQALSYGRQQHGLNGGGDDHQSWNSNRPSPDVEDRTNESQLGNTLMAPVMSTVGNAYSLYQRGSNALGLNDAAQQAHENDPMSQAAGINDMDTSQGLQGLGDTGEDTNDNEDTTRAGVS